MTTIGRIARTASIAAALSASAVFALQHSAHAQSPAKPSLKVEAPWVRGAVPGQLSTGAFMDITSGRDASLVAVESPIAGIVEVHSMEMKGNLMTMRAVDKIDLPAGKQVRLAPGGFHIMLMDLKEPLVEGNKFPVTLTFAHAGTIEVQLVVGSINAAEPEHKM